MLLVPLVLGAGAVGVYYLTLKNRGKKHSSRRHRSSRRSSRGGYMRRGGGWGSMSRPMGSMPRPMGPMVGTDGSGIRPRGLMGGKKSRKHKKH
jgi:hypothetical protein